MAAVGLALVLTVALMAAEQAAQAQDLFQSYGGVSIYRTVRLDAQGRDLGEDYNVYNTNAYTVCLWFWVTEGRNYTSTLIGRGPLIVPADGEAALGSVMQVDPARPSSWETWIEVGTDCY